MPLATWRDLPGQVFEPRVQGWPSSLYSAWAHAYFLRLPFFRIPLGWVRRIIDARMSEIPKKLEECLHVFVSGAWAGRRNLTIVSL
tara:strand:- start:183 stop:440 length:258 start_codon:yes stop_codon:yes gene_type:complete